MKAAIIGCGAIAQVHKKVLLTLPEAELAACCDIKRERAEEFASSCGICAYTDVEAMLDAEKPEIVHLCVPHPLHTPLAVLCVRRGIHVFTEKPPVVSEEQWRQFAALQGEKARVGICFQNRYNSSVQAARALLGSSDVGQVLGARAFLTWRREPEYYTGSDWRGSWRTEGGGVLINQAIHTLDLLVYLLGKPSYVQSHMSNHSLQREIEVEDTLEANIRFASGVHALFYATNAYCANAPVMIEIACEKASLRIEGDSLTVLRADGTQEPIQFDQSAPLGKDYWGNGHYTCIRDFYRCILKDIPYQNDIPSVENTMDLMLKIYAPYRGRKVAEE